MRNYFYGLIVILMLICSVANPSVAPNLNVASVPVSNMSVEIRQKALPPALGQVLVKMSGNPAITTIPMIQNAMDDADGLIKSYSYSREILDNGNAQLMLHVTFDRKALKKLLRRAGQAYWQKERPLTLLWFQIQNTNDQEMLSNTNDPSLSHDILNTAKARGIPVVLPAMDLQDHDFVKTDANGGVDPSLLQQAAARYGATAILVGVVNQGDQQWRGTWTFYLNDAPFHWQGEADSLSSLCQQAVNEMANLMANQLAVVNDKDLQTNVTVRVDNVAGLEDYAKVLLTLRHLSQVAGVSVIDMDASDLILNVKTIGGAQALSDALSKQTHFVSTETPDNLKNKVDLSYRWSTQYSNLQNTLDQGNG